MNHEIMQDLTRVCGLIDDAKQRLRRVHNAKSAELKRLHMRENRLDDNAVERLAYEVSTIQSIHDRLDHDVDTIEYIMRDTRSGNRRRVRARS